METYKCYYNSPIGMLEILANGSAISSVEFVKEDPSQIDLSENENIKEGIQVLKDCVLQLEEYFQGERRDFSLRLEPEGTDFQKRAWEQLKKIRYGETISYGEQARRMGDDKASRAVGGANGKNKISIIIPCHRVIGKNGKLVGFGAGLWRKKWLLNHEQRLQNKEE
jgi:methylated-DNA-[protein]-cysteine S-methyltransferase